MQEVAKVSQNGVASQKEGVGIESWNLDEGGRPLKLTDPHKVGKLLDDYFKETPLNEWTITGVCLKLGIDRNTIVNVERSYAQKGGNKDVIQLIKNARLKVHNAYEVDLRNKNNPSGSIFALKNFGWTDERQIDHTSGGQAFAVNVLAFGTPESDNPAVDADFEEVTDDNL